MAACVWIVLGCAGLDGASPDPPEEVEIAPRPVLSPRFFYLPGPAGVETARFSKWSPGDRLFVGVDGANLRADATTASEVVTKLRLAEEVEVMAAEGESTVLIGRRNTWYRIRTRVGAEGYLFGAILSPIRVSTFEGDDVAQVAVVTFSPTYGPRLRAWTPPDGAIQALDAEPPERYADGGTISARTEGSSIVVSTCSDADCQDITFGWRDGELTQLDPPPPPK